VPPLVSQEATKGDLQAGREAFSQFCANCHGEDGRNGEFGDLNDKAFLALVSDQILRRYIITGRHDLGMPDFADPKGRDKTTFKPLTSQEVSDIVALLASWRTATSSED
jgi:mono/diheme cytochrome c family protein